MRFLGWKGHAVIALLARLYLGGLFVHASWHKILHPHTFALDVATYQILPLVLVNLFALVLPWVELLSGIMLIVGFRTRAASLLVTGMMVMFMVALGSALARGLNMSCGCFASDEADLISWRTMFRDAAWLALAVYVLLCDRRPLGVDRMLESRSKR